MAKKVSVPAKTGKKAPSKAIKKTAKANPKPTKRVSIGATKPAKKIVAKKVASRTLSKSEVKGLKVKDVMRQVDPKLTLSDDAVELLEDFLTQTFEVIANKAEMIVKQACK